MSPFNRAGELADALRELDPQALTFPDRLGGAAFIYHAEGKRLRLTFCAPCLIYNALEVSGEAAPLPRALTLPVWAIRGREAPPEREP